MHGTFTQKQEIRKMTPGKISKPWVSLIEKINLMYLANNFIG